MSDEAEHLQEAFNALIRSGRTVERISDDHHLWAVEGEQKILTDNDLIALARKLSLMSGHMPLH